MKNAQVGFLASSDICREHGFSAQQLSTLLSVLRSALGVEHNIRSMAYREIEVRKPFSAASLEAP